MLTILPPGQIDSPSDTVYAKVQAPDAAVDVFPRPTGEQRNIFIRTFSSVTLGVFLMCFILAYACVASALPQVRGALEMTEMQIFRHWIFAGLIVLFCVSLITVTLTRIRWSLINAGVWIVHVGLLLLAGGSFWYFSTKIEGDVPLFSPRVEIVSTGAGGQRVIGKTLAEKGQSWSSFMPAFGGNVRCDILETAGTDLYTVTQAKVSFASGTAEPKTIDLSANEEATSLDNGRLATRLVRSPPASTFYDDHRAALYIRSGESSDAEEFELPGLPLHRERYLDEGYVLQDSDGNPVPSKRQKPAVSFAGVSIPTGLLEGWELPITPRAVNETINKSTLPFDIQVTGYVPYIADMRATAIDGGDQENPATVVALTFGKQVVRESLFALDPAKSMMMGPLPIEFRWVSSPEEVEQLLAPPAGPDELIVEVKEPPVRKQFAIQTGQTITIDGTDYELSVKELRPTWPMMTPGYEGAVSPMASIDVKNKTKSYNRTVIQRFPQLSQDIDEQGVRHREGPYDPNLVLRYRNSSDGWITIVAGPNTEPIAGIFADDGSLERVPITVNRQHNFNLRGVPLGLTVEGLYRNGRVIEQPIIEPLERRRPSIAARSMSAIRLRLTGRGENAGWSESRWCLFSQYPHVDARPLNVRIPGSDKEYEIIYSRHAHHLGAELGAGKLSVKFLPGRQSVESWRSDFRYRIGDGSSSAAPAQTAAVYTNQTCNVGPWTFYQSGAAADHWSYTILGVGNRNGIWPMILGCMLIALGCIYAFYIKPILIRRKRRRESFGSIGLSDVGLPSNPARLNPPLALIIAFLVTAFASSSVKADEPFVASQGAIQLDKQIDWTRAKLIAVQDAGRYKTLDSFARESLSALYGHENFPGLSPVASLMELLFRKDAYIDTPLIRIKDRGIQIHLTAHMPEAAMRRIRETGYMTPREFDDPIVAQRIAELEPSNTMVNAMRRVRGAEEILRFVDQMICIVPDPAGSTDAAWCTPEDLKSNLPSDMSSASTPSMQRPSKAPNVTPQQALSVLGPWAGLWKAWNIRDVAAVQSNLDRLVDVLPTLSREGVYPSPSQRAAEARYYAWGKFTWGFWIYFVGGLVGIWALVTRWKAPRYISMSLLILALGVHTYGLALRWFILGRIPVANMFEALTASAWVGIVLALVVELFYRTRFFLVAAQFTGFLALLLAGYVVPGGGTLTFIMGILDDIMLRIHTVLIISSYSLIFLAAVIAVIYLFGYYLHTAPKLSSEVGFIVSAAGAVLLLVAKYAFVSSPVGADGIVKANMVGPMFWIGTGICALFILLQLHFRSGPRAISYVVAAMLACGTLAIGDHGFTTGMAWTMIGVGMVWALASMVGIALTQRSAIAQLSLATVGGGSMRLSRPILAGAMPGDESSRRLPAWLQHCDWSHLIILNMMFIMLFVGVILGAVWADYSWGRPWGWDPKEVFAMNTWIVYAILIHVRFLVRNKGLATAWLSIAGCLMMAFNWCFVNFYIVGLHSYA